MYVAGLNMPSASRSWHAYRMPRKVLFSSTKRTSPPHPDHFQRNTHPKMCKPKGGGLSFPVYHVYSNVKK
jgi:hypothetical protein